MTDPWHNQVHVEVDGDMGGVDTAPRDPLFWRWHGFIDTVHQSPPLVIYQVPFRLYRYITELPTVSVTFNQPVSGVQAGDLSVNGSPATSVSGSGAGPYEFSGFAAPPLGGVDIAVAPGAIRNAAGEAFTGASWSQTLIDPLADQDQDGLTDGDEVNLWLTDPTRPDTDGDGLPDAYEVQQPCLNPLMGGTMAGGMYAMTTDADNDPDGDGVTSRQEFALALNPCAAESEDQIRAAIAAAPAGWTDAATEAALRQRFGLPPADAATPARSSGRAARRVWRPTPGRPARRRASRCMAWLLADAAGKHPATPRSRAPRGCESGRPAPAHTPGSGARGPAARDGAASRAQATAGRAARRDACGPNILFFTCHDLGRHLGCYGYRSVHSPALDELAAGGVRFANAFCTAPQCSPSRASLHSGRYPHAAGVLGLAHHPYGWRLDPRPASGPPAARRGVQHHPDRDAAPHRPRRGGRAGVRARPAAPDRARGGRNGRGAAGRAGRVKRPFYLEVGFEETHRPYDFGGAKPDTSLGVEVPAYLPDSPAARADWAAFQGAVRQMDLGVGRILAALDALSLTADTWVVFAADHGIAMPRAKGTLYDPGIAVTLLMRWPAGGLAGGRVVAELVSNVDVIPTMLDALGLSPRYPLQGHSLWPLLRSEPATPRTEVFAEKTFHTYYEPMRAIRTADYKYIVNFEVSTAVDVPTDVQLSPISPP